MHESVARIGERRLLWRLRHDLAHTDCAHDLALTEYNLFESVPVNEISENSVLSIARVHWQDHTLAYIFAVYKETLA
jgi:hypothetical protein